MGKKLSSEETFTKVDTDIMRIPRNILSGDDKILLAKVIELNELKLGCIASNASLAESTGLTAALVSSKVSKLVDKGYLTRTMIYKGNSKQVLRRILKPTFIWKQFDVDVMKDADNVLEQESYKGSEEHFGDYRVLQDGSIETLDIAKDVHELEEVGYHWTEGEVSMESRGEYPGNAGGVSLEHEIGYPQNEGEVSSKHQKVIDYIIDKEIDNLKEKGIENIAYKQINNLNEFLVEKKNSTDVGIQPLEIDYQKEMGSLVDRIWDILKDNKYGDYFFDELFKGNYGTIRLFLPMGTGDEVIFLTEQWIELNNKFEQTKDRK